MIYKINFMNDEVDDFKLSFECDSEATFLDLHNAILEAVGYPNDQMTSFFMCNERWEKGQEVTLIEMPDGMDYDNMTMENTRLSELLLETKQRLIYIFDPMFERYFFGSLAKIEPNDMEGVRCVEKKGKAPKQLQTDEVFSAKKGQDDVFDMDDDFYGSSSYDSEDLDMEGFQDLSFEDGSMF